MDVIEACCVGGISIRLKNVHLKLCGCVSGLQPNLSEQGRSCSAQVVGDEQLGVGVDPCWVELPQWLEAKVNSV